MDLLLVRGNLMVRLSSVFVLFSYFNPSTSKIDQSLCLTHLGPALTIFTPN